MGKKHLKFVKEHFVWFLFLAGTAVAVFPSLVRWYVYGIPGIIGFPTYYHKRIAEYILSGNFNWYDPLSFGGRPYTYPPLFPFSLALSGLLLGVSTGGTLFMALLGGIAAVLVYSIAKETSGNEKLAVAVLLLSPGFVYLFSHFCSRSPPIVLGLAALYATVKKKRWYYAGMLLGIASLFHWETFLVFSAVVVLYDHKNRDVWKAVGMGLVIACLWYVPFLVQHGLPKYNSLHHDYVAKGYGLEPLDIKTFSRETGGNYDNVALITLLLSFAGLFSVKEKFYRKWFVLCITLALFTNRLLLYMVFPSAILASLVVAGMKKRLKGLAVPLFLIYVVAVGMVSAAQFGGFYPLKQEYKAMLWLKENTPDNATVFSHWGHGHWITGIAYRKSFMDGYAEYPPGDIQKRVTGYEEFFRSCRVPEGYGITHVFLEEWIIRENRMECIDSLGKPVYNESGIVVFKV